MTSVLIINPHFNLFGGAERQVVELANFLTSKNIKVVIGTTYACSEFKANLKETRILETGNEQNLLNFVTNYGWKFDVVNPHNHNCELFMPYPLKYKSIWQCNEPPGYVLEGHELNYNERLYVNRVINKVMVISEFDKARFRKLYGMDAIVNYPGIHYDFFSEEIKKRNTLNMKDNFVITQVGYWTWTKNQLKTVEIFSEVKKDIPNAKLVLVGYNACAKQYPYVKKVHDKISELGLEDDVFVNDYLSGDDNLKNIYSQTSICLPPTLSQGGYASVFEGISAGVPTIVSDDFIMSNVISRNKLGWVSSQNNEEYVNKINFIYNEYEKCKQETINNRIWIKNNLNWEKFGEKYKETIEDLIK